MVSEYQAVKRRPEWIAGSAYRPSYLRAKGLCSIEQRLLALRSYTIECYTRFSTGLLHTVGGCHLFLNISRDRWPWTWQWLWIVFLHGGWKRLRQVFCQYLPQLIANRRRLRTPSVFPVHCRPCCELAFIFCWHHFTPIIGGCRPTSQDQLHFACV